MAYYLFLTSASCILAVYVVRMSLHRDDPVRIVLAETGHLSIGFSMIRATCGLVMGRSSIVQLEIVLRWSD